MSFEQAAISSIRNNRALQQSRRNKKEVLLRQSGKRFCPKKWESSKIKMAKELQQTTIKKELFYLLIGMSILALGFSNFVLELVANIDFLQT